MALKLPTGDNLKRIAAALNDIGLAQMKIMAMLTTPIKASGNGFERAVIWDKA
jgi:hypothetical protein